MAANVAGKTFAMGTAAAGRLGMRQLAKNSLYASTAKRAAATVTPWNLGNGKQAAWSVGSTPDLKTNAMYDTVIKHGAYFRPDAKDDYHMPPYYSHEGHPAPEWQCPKKADTHPKPSWHDHVMMEMDNTCANAGIESCIYAKVDIRGRKATEFMNRISTRNVPRKVGQCRLAYVCRTDGRVMNDVSISTRGDNDLYIIGLGGWGKWEMDLLESLRDELGYSAGQVQLTNVSHDLELIHVMGPKVIDIVSKVLSPKINEIPFMHFGKVNLDGIELEIQRMSYSGLLGFELHCPVEHAPRLYDWIMNDPYSRQQGLKPHGLCAVQGLRTEMWFRGSADVKSIGHYSEVMIEKFIYDKKDFHGKDPSYTPKKMVVMLDADTPKGWEWSMHNGKYNVVSADGKEIGTTLSSAYGGRSRKVHAFAYLDADAVKDGKFKGKALVHGQEIPVAQMSEPVVPFTGKDF